MRLIKERIDSTADNYRIQQITQVTHTFCIEFSGFYLRRVDAVSFKPYSWQNAIAIDQFYSRYLF